MNILAVNSFGCNEEVRVTTNDPQEPQTITIPLTQDKTAVIDAIDADLVSLKWYARSDRRNLYAERDAGKTKLHRVILSRILGRDLVKGEQVDHINGDGLDNRRCNLRLVTLQQNCMNKRRQRNNTSGFKGVSFFKRTQKWCAFITLDRKQKYLGSFATAEEAHAAYCKAAKELYGDFARFE